VENGHQIFVFTLDGTTTSNDVAV